MKRYTMRLTREGISFPVLETIESNTDGEWIKYEDYERFVNDAKNLINAFDTVTHIEDNRLEEAMTKFRKHYFDCV